MRWFQIMCQEEEDKSGWELKTVLKMDVNRYQFTFSILYYIAGWGKNDNMNICKQRKFSIYKTYLYKLIIG